MFNWCLPTNLSFLLDTFCTTKTNFVCCFFQARYERVKYQNLKIKIFKKYQHTNTDKILTIKFDTTRQHSFLPGVILRFFV